MSRGARHKKHAQEIAKELLSFRVQIRDENETVSKKIRQGELQKIPYMIIVGDREIKNKTINVRFRDKKVQKEIIVKEFLELISNLCSNKKEL